MKIWVIISIMLMVWSRCQASGLEPVIPQECHVTGTQSELDFGEVNIAASLERKMRVTVTCRYPQRMLMRIDAQRAGNQFRWEGAGQLDVSFTNAQLDGRDISLRSEHEPEGRLAVRLKASPGMRFLPAGQQQSGTMLSFDVDVRIEKDPYASAPRVRMNPLSAITISLD